MRSIPQTGLRDQVSEMLRRVEGGEAVIITVAGRPVAELRPASRRRWVSGEALEAVFRGPAPRTLRRDLDHLGGIVDPYSA